MGHTPPEPAVAAGIPSLKWPLIWLALTGYLVLASFVDFTIDREADAGAALIMFPICIIFFAAALNYYQKRIQQRQAWRQARYEQVLDRMYAWPMPEIHDWYEFEDHIEQQLLAAEEERQEKSPFDKPERTLSYKERPGTSDHYRGKYKPNIAHRPMKKQRALWNLYENRK